MQPQTGSQTIGPYLAIGLFRAGEVHHVLTNDQTQGQRIQITGILYDGDREPILDGMVEIWQPDAQGIYNHPADPRQEQADPAFRGYGRSQTVDGGRFTFKTVKPGSVPFDDDTMQAPHINVRIFGRGMLLHSMTRIYFSDETANEHDPVLTSLDEDRRQTLIATLEDTDDLPTYTFNIYFQGDNETVFFNP